MATVINQLRVGEHVTVGDQIYKVHAFIKEHGSESIVADLRPVSVLMNHDPAAALKPFDLEAAKGGAPVQTRDGRKVSDIVHVPKAAADIRVAALIEGDTLCKWFYEDGLGVTGSACPYDLFMTPVERTVYVNFYPDNIARHYNTASEAVESASMVDALAIAFPATFQSRE